MNYLVKSIRLDLFEAVFYHKDQSQRTEQYHSQALAAAC
jgi:hypothetical protein